jgi:fructosamine-3-kinase
MNKYDSIEAAVSAAFGEGIRITKKSITAGGDINRAYAVTLSDGRRAFLKENNADNLDFFVKEAAGLEAIRKTGVFGVPELYGYGVDGGNAFLLMEQIVSGRRVPDYYEDFGRRLAAMHRSDCSEYTGSGKYGFRQDNYIGAGYQDNTPENSWIVFFREHRLLPQIKRAERYLEPSTLRDLDRLLNRLEELLTEPDKPALIHGDLWSGNQITGPDGRVWLIDPAVYVGHPEADIAMTELFDRLPEAFYDGYFGGPDRPYGYKERRDLYNLYHWLNHLNLFGVDYLGYVVLTIRKYL